MAKVVARVRAKVAGNAMATIVGQNARSTQPNSKHSGLRVVPRANSNSKGERLARDSKTKVSKIKIKMAGKTLTTTLRGLLGTISVPMEKVGKPSVLRMVISRGPLDCSSPFLDLHLHPSGDRVKMVGTAVNPIPPPNHQGPVIV